MKDFDDKCRFTNSLGICGSPLSKNETQCDKVPIDLCYFKQLQQTKTELDDMKARKDRYYLQTLDDEVTISNLIKENMELIRLKDDDSLRVVELYQKYKNIKDCILNYIECYEGTPDECIKRIKEILEI